MIADRLRTRIAAADGLGQTLSAAEYAQIDALLGNPQNLPYLYLGCQGPDFLFFNTNDISPTIKDLVSAYFDVYDFIENFKRDLLKVVPQPVLDALAAFDEAANAVVTSSSTLTELQELFGDMQQVVDGLLAMVLEAVKSWVSEFSLFDLVSHPYRDGVPEGAKPAGFSVPAARAAATNEWWWFDAMHYRKTGKLARKLLEKTTPGSPLHLYAIGYLTHVSADTVGHPYVNAISGGPYRSHAQRHKASENYQDTFNFLDVRGADWNRSAIHAFYNFNFTGPIDTENDEPDPFTNLPNALAALITDALNEIYDEDGTAPTPDYAKPITTGDINDTYRLWYRWYKSATDTGTLPPPVPYSLSAELREVWDQVVDNLDSIGDFLEDAADTAGDLGIWGIFLLLGALILAALAAAAALIDAVLGALTTLGSATIRYAACLIYEQLYNAFETFRLAVAMNGLAFPMLEHLTDPRITHFANPDLPDANGNNVSSILGRLPTLRWVGAGLTHNERHLVYPPTSAEAPSVFAVPASYLDEDVHLVRVGRHPAEARHPRRAAEARPEPRSHAERRRHAAGGPLRRQEPPRERTRARGGAVRADEGRSRPARLQPRRRPRLRLHLLEPAGRPGARLPRPRQERCHPARAGARSTSSADAGGHRSRRSRRTSRSCGSARRGRRPRHGRSSTPSSTTGARRATSSRARTSTSAPATPTPAAARCPVPSSGSLPTCGSPRSPTSARRPPSSRRATHIG